MHNYEIVFQKVIELVADHPQEAAEPSCTELDELEELRRFSAELREPELLSLTTTV